MASMRTRKLMRTATTEAVRSLLRPDLRTASEAEVAEILAEALAGMNAQEREDFLKGVGTFFKNALPGAATGASTGAMFGPWGALIGGLAGAGLSGATALMQQNKGRKKGRRPTPPAPSRSPTPAAPTGAAPQTAPPKNAAAQLLGLLNNPAVTQSLLSVALGDKGKRSVPGKSGSDVPIGAIMNALSQLVTTVSKEAARGSEAEADDGYLRDAHGAYAIDPTDALARAEWVVAQLGSGEHEAAPAAIEVSRGRRPHRPVDPLAEWIGQAAGSVIVAEVH